MTFGQMLTLFEHSEKEAWGQMKFQAALQGIDLDKPGKGRKTTGKTAQLPYVAPVSNDGENLTFGDPKDYAKMNPEEKEEKTKKMKTFFKTWAKQTPMEKGKLKDASRN